MGVQGKVNDGGETLGWTERDPTQARRDGIQSMPGEVQGDELSSGHGEQPAQITAGSSGSLQPRATIKHNRTTRQLSDLMCLTALKRNQQSDQI